MIRSYRASEHSRATEDNMTMEGVVLGKHSNNAGVWLGKAGVVETVSEGREGNVGINKNRFENHLPESGSWNTDRRWIFLSIEP